MTKALNPKSGRTRYVGDFMKKPRTFTRLTITLSPDLAHRLTELRERTSASNSALIEFALKSYLEGRSDEEFIAEVHRSGASKRRSKQLR